MAKDFIYKDGDLQIKNGDFLIDESDQQHVEDILVAFQGEYTQNPVLGVGISSYLRAPMDAKIRQDLEREIKLQVEADGGKDVVVSVNSMDDININAKYEG